MKIRVVIIGACGRMGQEVVRAVLAQEDMLLAGAVEKGKYIGEDIGEIVEKKKCGVYVTENLERLLAEAQPSVCVDFTTGAEAGANIEVCLQHRIPAVVGTTGIPAQVLDRIGQLSRIEKTPVFVAPNFSLGTVLMMKFATEASRYFSTAEILEMHHDKKLDAPSGTAIRTAELMLKSRDQFISPGLCSEKLSHVRGGEMGGVRIHSVRLPGLLAHQEVIFGGDGEILTIRHDSTARTSFMPGVMLAIRKIRSLEGLIIGLENLLDEL